MKITLQIEDFIHGITLFWYTLSCADQHGHENSISRDCMGKKIGRHLIERRLGNSSQLGVCLFIFIDILVHAQMSPRTSLTRPHDDTTTQHRHTHRVGALISSYPEDKITPVGPSRTPTVHRSPEGEAVGGSTAHTCHMHDTGVQHTFTTLLISTRRRHENGWTKKPA